jgi:hypothetical protein
VRTFPTAPNRANLTLREVADAYMAAYDGRDPGRAGTVGFWVRHLGALFAGDGRCGAGRGAEARQLVQRVGNQG